MQKILILLLLTTCIFASEIEEIFGEVMDDQFGNTLVEGIQLQLESGAAVDTLIDNMRDVRDGLRGQLQDGENAHEATSDACSSDLSEYMGALTQAQADMGQYTQTMELDTSTLASRVEEQTNRQAELGERNAMKENMQGQRDQETDRFNTILQEHRMVGDVLAEVRQIIMDRLMNAGEFLETNTNMFLQVSDKLKSYNVEKKGRAHGYQALFTLLAQMLERNQQHHGDQVVVQNILDLLDQIEENLDASLSLERAAESERENDFVELMQRIDDQIHYCESSLVELSSTIFTLQSRVTAAQDRYNNAEQAVTDWTQRVNDRQAECSAASGVWENFYNNITAELSTCAKVMYLLEDRRALLARYGL